MSGALILSIVAVLFIFVFYFLYDFPYKYIDLGFKKITYYNSYQYPEKHYSSSFTISTFIPSFVSIISLGGTVILSMPFLNTAFTFFCSNLSAGTKYL